LYSTLSTAGNVSNETIKPYGEEQKQGDETVQITVKAKLIPTMEQREHLKTAAAEYIRLINTLVSECIQADERVQHTSGTISAALPSALKNQALEMQNQSTQSTERQKSEAY